MKLFNLALKLNSLFAGNIACQSFMLADNQVQGGFDSNEFSLQVLNLVIDKLVDFVANLIYLICTFVMNFIELIQIAVSRILGIGVDIEDYVVIDSTNPLVKMLTSETVLTVFKSVLGVSIVLIIIFTIFALVKSEYQFALEKSESNSKGRILGRALRSFFTLGMFPLILLLGVVLTNAILAGFNDILRDGDSTNMAARIFTTSAYNANNYRNYAKDDERVPIVINFEDPYNNGTISGYSDSELAKFYSSFQETGREIYNNFADSSFTDFSDTIVYKNNRIYNKSSYAGFEKFAVTREQYYVMADFIDYAIEHNITYYVKNIQDVDIDWKYVDNTVFDKETCSLTITYRDTSNLNNGKSYKVVYTPTSESVSTPISDALKTISALLAFDEYEDSTFNVLKRLEDSINIVEWETDKVLIKLSENYKTSPTKTDELILFEQARFEYNNSINATVTELATKGVELPAQKITKRTYDFITNDYIVTDEYYFVTINGRNFEVELNEDLKDENGNFVLDSYSDPYYTLVESDFGIKKVTVSGEKYYIGGKEINKNDVINISAGSISGKYAWDDDSFKDILVYVEEGTAELRGEDGSVSYITYGDQVETVIKQDAWPNKLIRDLQIIYKDININNLIASGNWLEQLSEYVGGSQYGDYSSNIQTGLIHPLGLIMSEFFLGNVSVSEDVLTEGDLIYSSQYDSDTIKALILSLLGEDRYFQTKEQINYFVEIFNAFMAPVLEEIAYYESFELMSGNDQSVQLYTYKAYLASVMLSSSASEWFYSTANALLGATVLKEAMVDSSGYIKKYSDMSTSYQSLIKKVYDQANQRLKDQYVESGDKAYPEYMYALEAYINGGDYFQGRLDLILKSVLSTEKKGKAVDDAKKEVKTTYNNLINKINSNLSKLSADDKELFETNIKKYLWNPSSCFSYEQNDFLLKNSSNQLYGEKEKDDLDLISNTFQIVEARDNISEFNASVYTQGSLSYYLESLGMLDSGTITAISEYYSAVSNYLDKKDEFITTDNSSSNVGNHDELLEEAEKYFEQAKSLYSDVKGSLGNNAIIKSGLSASKMSDFSTKTKWNNLISKYNTMKNNYNASNDEDGKIGLYIESVGGYIRTQQAIDQLNRYEILFALESEMTESASSQLDIVVNSKHYSVGQNFTKAKFIEYVLGYQTCIDLGYSPVFVSEGYEGIVKLQKATDSDIDTFKAYLKTLYPTEESTINEITMYRLKNYSQYEKYFLACTQKFTYKDGNFYILSNSFSDVYDFAVELGNVSASLYQMSNLSNLSSASIDEIVIGSGEAQAVAVGGTKNHSQIILQMILDGEYLPSDLVCAFFDVTEDGGAYTNAKAKITEENASTYLNTVMSYLLMTESDKDKKDFVDYSTLTLKELRIRCLKALIDFEQQNGETVEQNQKRYLTLLALGCSDWADGNGVGALECNWSKSREDNIQTLKVSNQSQAIILRLAGLENRPYEELVDAEYTIDFNLLGEDEQNGDIFIICIFDDETKKYVPFMMANKSSIDSDQLEADEDDNTFFKHYGYKNAYTTYYTGEGTVAYPIIAKGVVTADGMPTAIRRVDGNIEYYRDNVVIRNASDIGLEEYYASPDQLKVHHTALSSITNFVSKVFTGKSLIENLASAIPKFAAHTNYNFCFGVNTETTATVVGGKNVISYNFGRGDSMDMYYLYDVSRLNLLLLIIGVACLFGALLKALFGVIGRVFDVTIDFLLGPLAITTINLKADEKDSKGNLQETSVGYESWKGKITADVLNVLSYAIGFNIFFILSPIVMSVEYFETTEAFASLPFFNLITIDFLNNLMQLLFVIGLAFMTTRAPKLFANIIKVDNGFDRGESVKNDINNMKNEVANVWSGKNVADDLKTVKSSIYDVTHPGSEIVKEAGKRIQNTAAKVANVAAQAYLQAEGVPKEAAKELGKALEKVIEYDDIDGNSNKKPEKGKQKEKDNSAKPENEANKQASNTNDSGKKEELKKESSNNSNKKSSNSGSSNNSKPPKPKN